jgi:hypothetical protein
VKGQQAMAYAMVYPEPAKLKRAGSLETKHPDIHKTRFSQARTVLREAKDLASRVLNGSLGLDDAYRETMLRLGRTKTEDDRMRVLESARPDHGGI